jgi:hypothetical protein
MKMQQEKCFTGKYFNYVYRYEMNKIQLNAEKLQFKYALFNRYFNIKQIQNFRFLVFPFILLKAPNQCDHMSDSTYFPRETSGLLIKLKLFFFSPLQQRGE